MPFDPSTIGGLWTWLKADAITGLSDGDPITTWEDSSVNNRDATQATAANKPLYKTNIVSPNSLPATQWDGTNDHLFLPDASALTAATAFIFVKCDADPPVVGDGQMWRFGSGGSNDHYPYVDGNIYDGFGSPDRKSTGNPALDLSEWRTYTVLTKAGEWTSWIDGAQHFTTGTNTVGFSTTPTLGNMGNVHKGYIAEFLLYDNDIGSSNRSAVWDYLIEKWLTEPPPPPAVARQPGIREKPPLRLMVNAIAPNGNTVRWGPDENDPANVPSGLSFGTEMPGGFSSLSCTLPRKPETDYSDLKRLSTLKVYGAGQSAWEGRLESAPRVSGNQMSVAPQAVGWQAHLDDDTSAKMVYVDRDLNGFGPISRARRIALATNFTTHDPAVALDPTTGIPALVLRMEESALQGYGDALYDAGAGLTIASVYYDFAANSQVNPANVNWSWGILAHDADDFSGTTYTSGDLSTASTGTGTFTPTAPMRFISPMFRWAAALAGGTNYELHYRRLTLWGNHGLTKRGTAPSDGLYASDVVGHAIRTWAPLLRYSTGASGSITDTSFIIPQLVFKEPTTAGEIISAANRYHLYDWAVWEGRIFYFHPRAARGKVWRARVAPAQLEEAGPSIENLYNGVVVRFQDVDGTTKTVGPTGSGANTISTSVMDTDPLNPANELGIRRWALLDMGGVSTPAGATEVGRRFLIETAQYNTSGRAQIVGHVEDDRGVLYPYWRVRAGDTIVFVDAAYTEPRRIVRTSCDDSSKTNSIDLDAPPEGLSALLERLQVVLVGVL